MLFFSVSGRKTYAAEDGVFHRVWQYELQAFDLLNKVAPSPYLNHDFLLPSDVTEFYKDILPDLGSLLRIVSC